MAATNNMHNLTTLIKRLEAATSRLEDIATSVDGPILTPMTTPSQLSVNKSISTSHSVTPTATPLAAAAAPPPEPLPRSIEAFDKILENEVDSFVAAAQKIGGLVEEQAQAVRKAFQAERTFLLVSTKAKKPESPPPELMADIHRYTSVVDELREANRPSPLFVHLSAVSEGIVALGWIVDSRPADFVTSTLGGAQYYGNKILKEYKEKDKTHVEYMQAYYKIFRSMQEYVTEHYKSGLTWNQKDGIDALEALNQIQSGQTAPKAAPGAGGAPPPPPPPLPTFEQLNGAPLPPPPPPVTGSSKGGDMSAVFDQLNQGSSVTSGLRKVDKSEMTHKNPSLRAAGSVPARSSSQTSTGSAARGKSPMPAKKPENLRTKKPSRKELDGTKWIVENFDNTGSEIIEIPAELNHSILISRCTKCVIKVNGKANAISIDNCNGLSILLGSLVSSLDVIKSPKFAVQVDGVLPTILLDQVDGAQIYLGEQSVKTPPEVLTSKCSSINIVLPPKGNEDSREEPLPEQLRTYFKNGKLVTEVVEHAG